VAGVTVNDGAVAPAIGLVVIPVVPMYHWYELAPVAVTDSVAEPPAVIVVAAGCVVIVNATTGFAVTTNGAELAEQPLAFVTVTVYVPAADTVIDCVVSPVDQRFPLADEEVSVTVLPAQTSEPAALIVGVGGSGLTVTTNGAELAEPPSALVTVTVYVPAAETMIDCVVAPVDQTLPVAAEDVSVIVLPAQNELGPLIVGVGGTGAAVAVTTNGAEVAEQPLASVTVTV
jgi:hypothetical protein